jgi:hypothetical protein
MNDHVSLPADYVLSVVKNWVDEKIDADKALELLLTAQDKIREQSNADKH